MTITQTKPLEVRVIGFDAGLKKRIKALWDHVVLETWTFSSCRKDIRVKETNSLWVAELKQLEGLNSHCLKNFLDQTKSSSPIFLLSDWKSSKSHVSSLFENLLESIGAQVFVGRTGFDQFCMFLQQTADRDPSEIIVSVKVSDDGLHVSFADSTKAVISLPHVKRLAESDQILWDSIRIAGDRTYITVATKDTETIPIPHDVLREFVGEEAKKRIKANVRQRKLTAGSVGARVRSAREGLGLRQEDLAAKAQTSRWTIHRIEKGIYLPKVSLLEKLSRALNQNIEDLLVH